MSPTSLAEERYLAVTTFRAGGEPVSTPVWVVPVSDGRIGFWTSMGSGKTTRLAQDPRVLVQPCSVRGRIRSGSTAAAGTATMVRSGLFFDEVRARVRRRHPVLSRISGLLARFGRQRRNAQRYADTVVLVRLDPADVPETPAAAQENSASPM